jgi:hypothetical protein
MCKPQNLRSRSSKRRPRAYVIETLKLSEQSAIAMQKTAIEEMRRLALAKQRYKDEGRCIPAERFNAAAPDVQAEIGEDLRCPE